MKLYENTLTVRSDQSRTSGEAEEQARCESGGLRLRCATLSPNGHDATASEEVYESRVVRFSRPEPRRPTQGDPTRSRSLSAGESPEKATHPVGIQKLRIELYRLAMIRDGAVVNLLVGVAVAPIVVGSCNILG